MNKNYYQFVVSAYLQLAKLCEPNDIARKERVLCEIERLLSNYKNEITEVYAESLQETYSDLIKAVCEQKEAHYYEKTRQVCRNKHISLF